MLPTILSLTAVAKTAIPPPALFLMFAVLFGWYAFVSWRVGKTAPVRIARWSAVALGATVGTTFGGALHPGARPWSPGFFMVVSGIGLAFLFFARCMEARSLP